MQKVGSSGFWIALTQELMRNAPNWYGSDNWDAERFGAEKSPPSGFVMTQIARVVTGLSSGKAALVAKDMSSAIENLSHWEELFDGISWFYDMLGDEPSRATLIKVIAYRILGYRKVKLPLNTRDYWSQREFALSLIKGEDSIKVDFQNWMLRRFSLENTGFPIEIYFLPVGVTTTFILKQYEYRKRTPVIKAQDGDYVIDAGGCWGDTALYFANTVGEEGRIYSFEFAPDNLEVFRRNLDLNPYLSGRVKIVERALWDKSAKIFTYSPGGPATHLRDAQGSFAQVSTLCIDDFVREQSLPRVDFIKMDIEGAELNALKGAEATICAFRPRLAIAMYHKPEDLVLIPDYLHKLGLGYEFFLDHFTIHQEETVLFASPKAF